MSNIQSLQSSPAVVATQNPLAQGTQPAPTMPDKPVVSMPDRPKVVAPKPNDIHYNPAEMAKRLDDAVSMLNAQVNSHNLSVNFSVDKSFAIPVVTVRDNNSGEVIRQFPNNTAIEIAHSIDTLKGILHSSKV